MIFRGIIRIRLNSKVMNNNSSKKKNRKSKFRVKEVIEGEKIVKFLNLKLIYKERHYNLAH